MDFQFTFNLVNYRRAFSETGKRQGVITLLEQAKIGHLTLLFKEVINKRVKNISRHHTGMFPFILCPFVECINKSQIHERTILSHLKMDENIKKNYPRYQQKLVFKGASSIFTFPVCPCLMMSITLQTFCEK